MHSAPCISIDVSMTVFSRHGMNMPNRNDIYMEATFESLQQKIEAAEKNGEPIDCYVKQQIAILEDAHTQFLATATAQGYQLSNPRLGEIEVRQFSAMKQLAQKIGLPSHEYEDRIKEVQTRIFGEANYKRFFEDKG